MEKSISFKEFESYSSDSDDIEWAIAQAKMKKVLPKIRKVENEFDALIRTSHFEDAHKILIKALCFVKENPKLNWNSYFREEFRHYPPRGLFGRYGRMVSALYLSDETLSLIEHLDQFIEVKQRELTKENILQTNREILKVRETLSQSGQISVDALRELVPDLKKRGTDWRLGLLERSREIKLTDDVIFWVLPVTPESNSCQIKNRRHPSLKIPSRLRLR